MIACHKYPSNCHQLKIKQKTKHGSIDVWVRFLSNTTKALQYYPRSWTPKHKKLKGHFGFILGSKKDKGCDVINKIVGKTGM